MYFHTGTTRKLTVMINTLTNGDTKRLNQAAINIGPLITPMLVYHQKCPEVLTWVQEGHSKGSRFCEKRLKTLHMPKLQLFIPGTNE